MNDLITAVGDWPVLLQGAIGSGLFWVFLFFGQKITSAIIAKYSFHSSISRRSHLISKMYKYSAFSGAEPENSAFYVATLIYRSTRHLFKGLMWLSLGLIFQSFFSISGIIGFAGCLYYLFKAYDVVKPYPEDIDIQAELAKVEKELFGEQET